MIERTQDRFGIWRGKLVADAAYRSAENLAWLVHERGIEPHMPVFDKSQRRNGTFSRFDFAYDHIWKLKARPKPGFSVCASLGDFSNPILSAAG